MGFLREPSHLILVVLVLVILFGSRRLPDAAQGLGKAMRIFKSEVKQMADDDKPRRAANEPSVVAEPLEGKVVQPQPPRSDERHGETPRNL